MMFTNHVSYQVRAVTKPLEFCRGYTIQPVDQNFKNVFCKLDTNIFL